MPSDRRFLVSIKTWQWMNNNFATELSHHTHCWAGNRNTPRGFTFWDGPSNPFDWLQSLVQRKAVELREAGDGQRLCQLEVDRMACMIEDTRIARENPGSFVPYPEMVEPSVNMGSQYHRDLITETAIHMLRYTSSCTATTYNYTLVNPFS